jgi:hypothetical protein
MVSEVTLGLQQLNGAQFGHAIPLISTAQTPPSLTAPVMGRKMLRLIQIRLTASSLARITLAYQGNLLQG